MGTYDAFRRFWTKVISTHLNPLAGQGGRVGQPSTTRPSPPSLMLASTLGFRVGRGRSGRLVMVPPPLKSPASSPALSNNGNSGSVRSALLPEHVEQSDSAKQLSDIESIACPAPLSAASSALPSAGSGAGPSCSATPGTVVCLGPTIVHWKDCRKHGRPGVERQEMGKHHTPESATLPSFPRTPLEMASIFKPGVLPNSTIRLHLTKESIFKPGLLPNSRVRLPNSRVRFADDLDDVNQRSFSTAGLLSCLRAVRVGLLSCFNGLKLDCADCSVALCPALDGSDACIHMQRRQLWFVLVLHGVLPVSGVVILWLYKTPLHVCVGADACILGELVPFICWTGLSTSLLCTCLPLLFSWRARDDAQKLPLLDRGALSWSGTWPMLPTHLAVAVPVFSSMSLLILLQCSTLFCMGLSTTSTVPSESAPALVATVNGIVAALLAPLSGWMTLVRRSNNHHWPLGRRHTMKRRK